VLLSPPPPPGMVALPVVVADAFADEEAQRVSFGTSMRIVLPVPAVGTLVWTLSFVRLSLVDMICTRIESASALVHSIGDVNRKEGKRRHNHVCQRTRHHCRQNLGLPPTIAWDLEIATLL
jgi:hypothetical protein